MGLSTLANLLDENAGLNVVHAREHAQLGMEDAPQGRNGGCAGRLEVTMYSTTLESRRTAVNFSQADSVRSAALRLINPAIKDLIDQALGH